MNQDVMETRHAPIHNFRFTRQEQTLAFVCEIVHTCVNKKVLLRERKRHTDRGVSSTPHAVLSGGAPTLVGGGGVVPTLARGYLLWLGGTYLGWGGTDLGWGDLPWLGVPTLAGLPPGCGQTENITSRLVLPTRSVMKKNLLMSIAHRFHSQPTSLMAYSHYTGLGPG